MTDMRLAYAMSERQLQDNIRKLCEHLHLKVQHIEDSRRAWLPGWPDLAVISTAIVFAELKSQTGDMSGDQRKVRRAIEATGHRCYLWRPSDLLSGEVARVLSQISTLPAAVWTAGDIERIIA